MSDRTDEKMTMSCRAARRRLAALTRSHRPTLTAGEPTAAGRAAVERHLENCAGCAREQRLLALGVTTLDHAGSAESLAPADEFFVQLRARLARGPARDSSDVAPDDSWAAVLLLASRQLIPAMAMLLLLIIGATLLWNTPQPVPGNTVAVRPSERVLFNDIYDYPEPTPDDVLETLVAVEEKENGK